MIGIVVVGWLVLHILFFYWFHKTLQLPFSIITAIFLAFFYSQFILAFFLCRARALHVLLFVVYVISLLYALLNYAYVQVFETFLQPTASQISHVNLAMIRLLKDFYFLVPWHVYLFGVLLVLITAVCLRLKLQTATTLTVAYRRACLIIALPLLLLYTLGFQWLANNQAAFIVRTNFSREAILADLSVFGYAFVQRVQYDAPVSTAIAQASAPEPVAVVAALPTNQDLFHTYLSQLGQLSGSLPSLASVPTFTKKPHIIIYQLESVDDWALRQSPSPMPYLQELMDTYWTSDNYFANGCTTIDAEFSINCSALPDSFGPVSDLYTGNSFECLPKMLQPLGYEPMMYHANDATFWSRDRLVPAWGFERMFFKPYFSFRQSDASMMGEMVTRMSQSKVPTFNYLIGMTSHSPHNAATIAHYKKTERLEIKPYSYPLAEELSGIDLDEKQTRAYLGFLTAVDDGIRSLFTQLEEANLLNDTIVVIFGDHRYYNFKSDNPLADFSHYNKIPLLMYVPNTTHQVIQPIASHINIAPTLWHLVTGSDEQIPPHFAGQSLLSTSYAPLAVNKCLGKAIYFDPYQIITGDITFDSYKSLISPAIPEDYLSALKGVIHQSDVLLQSNELRTTSPLMRTTQAQAIRNDQLTDTDKDGLSDLRESSLGTNPKNADTDGDGYSDSVEILNGYNPLGPGKKN